MLRRLCQTKQVGMAEGGLRLPSHMNVRAFPVSPAVATCQDQRAGLREKERETPQPSEGPEDLQEPPPNPKVLNKSSRVISRSPQVQTVV
mmetsp:Transcript_30178/g.59241  ORF Transcript_30178/g.59241 Transcript_30178/m.59241 type:complete len:90 (+) Transcript_30178:381-650(+)